MATVTKKKMKVLSTDGKAKVIRHTENGKMKSDMAGIRSCKYYDPNYLKKQDQNYLSLKRTNKE